MTFSTANFRASVTSARAKASDRISRIDRAQVQSALYNVAVAVGVIFYCVFLALRGAFRLGRTARDLWVKYEMAAKCIAAYKAIRADLQPVPLAERIAEVKGAYSAFAVRVTGATAKLQADYQDVRSEFAGDQSDIKGGDLLKLNK